MLAGLFPPRPRPLSEISNNQRVTVRGEVAPRDLIESSLTGERCVYYQYTIQEWKQAHTTQMGMDGFWQLVERDEAITEFYLISEGERAIVSPADARVQRGRGVPVLPVDLGGILNRRAQQLIIAPGDIVEVTATAEVVDDLFDEGRDYRASPERLMLRATKSRPLQLRLLSSSSRRKGSTPR